MAQQLIIPNVDSGASSANKINQNFAENTQGIEQLQSEATAKWIILNDTEVRSRNNASRIATLEEEGVGFTGDASDVAFDNPIYPNVAAALNSLLYVPLTASLSGGSTYEIGQTITSVPLTWSYNKTSVVSQSINNGIGSLSVALRAYTHSGQSITANRTYTLTANDGTQNATANTTVAFSHKRYWGVSTNDTLTDVQIRALSSEFSTTRVQTRTFDATGGRYLYIVYPASWGAASFTIGGFSFSGMNLTTRNFVNASGNSTSFYIYRSPLQTGSGIVMGVS